MPIRSIGNIADVADRGIDQLSGVAPKSEITEMKFTEITVSHLWGAVQLYS
jgi:hypothetical protein